MSFDYRLSRFTLTAQVALALALAVIFIVILPAQGFTSLSDFDDPAWLASAPLAMSAINWIHVLFGLTMFGLLLVFDRRLKERAPFVVRAAATLILFAALLWLVLHDVGFHIVNWDQIEQDPAATHYSLDTALWLFRDGVYLAAGALTALGIRRKPTAL
jgi:hypothetical protein